MYYLPTSCMLLFFLFSLFHHLPCALSQQECEALFHCGNITAGFPFSGGNRPQFCGHPFLKLHCFKNNTSLTISNHLYNVLQTDPTAKTLRLARAELQGSFCNTTFTNAILPPEIFELSYAYKSLTVFFRCNAKLPYNSSYKCPGRGPVSVSQTLDYHNSCEGSFTINVPKSFVLEEKELNLTHLESALREGFDVKLKIDEKACQRCSYFGESCGFVGTQVCCQDNPHPSGFCVEVPYHKRDPLDAKEQYRRCSTPFRCGDQKDLFYPFWTLGREDCGHPEFKLDCTAFIAEVSISSVNFRILEANRTSRIIRLVRSEYFSTFCPQNPLNVTFNENILQLAPGTEPLTIYYECPHLPTSTYVGELDCYDGKSSYYVTRNLSSTLLQPMSSLLNDFRESCKRNVSVPASGPALNMLRNNLTPDNLQKAVKEGFEVGLNQECLMCMDSGGVCGSNQTSSEFVCYCIDGRTNSTCGSRHKGFSYLAKIGSGIGATLLLYLVLILFLRILRMRKRKTSHDMSQQNLKPLIPQQKLKTLNPQHDLQALIPLKQYSYENVKIITNSFAEVVGKGGFGTVYRGTLCDGRSVAVKVLKDSEGNNVEDFINEVASMSQTSHVNIVTLLGFCSEGSNRAILYKFVENGSLDKFISSKRSSNRDWTTLYKIALGVARGLEYLHHGCRTRIVHFDIKPQNVLLDDDLCPKVADFGLAKLCERKESILSLLDARGTIGYIAPELLSKMYGRVSHKSDVYSYGMLVLEMIGARNKERADQEVGSNTSSMYFPEWIYKDLERGENGRFKEDGITCEEEGIAKKMTLVGLWCIQSFPSDRPPMNRVVEMMEGSVDALEVPPRPVFQIPTAPLQESSTLSEDISSSTEVCSMNVA